MRLVANLAFAAALALGSAGGAVAATALLSPADVDARLLVAPPPALGSPRALAEIAELKDLTAHRTPEQRASAVSDGEDETGAFFASAIGPGFDFAKLPATARMLGDIGATESVVSKAAKAYFHRDRPWIVAPDLDTCTPKKPGPAANSYPSGHATVAYSMGVVLASLLPDKAQAILQRASVFAENRLICGVHFRSDIVAGEAMGTTIAVKLLHDPAFKAEYDAAAAELRAAHL